MLSLHHQPNKFGGCGWTQTSNLWFVGPALCQLSYSRERWWSELESNQPFGLFRPALIRLSYPTVEGRAMNFSRPPPLLVVHLFNDGTVIVHIHEQVLAPLRSCFCIVAKHNAFEFHAQCCLRS